MIGDMRDKMADECFRHAAIDGVHRHVVRIVRAETEGDFRKIACADDESVALVGDIH